MNFKHERNMSNCSQMSSNCVTNNKLCTNFRKKYKLSPAPRTPTPNGCPETKQRRWCSLGAAAGRPGGGGGGGSRPRSGLGRRRHREQPGGLVTDARGRRCAGGQRRTDGLGAGSGGRRCQGPAAEHTGARERDGRGTSGGSASGGGGESTSEQSL